VHESGHSKAKIQLILARCLALDPPERTDFAGVANVIFDGKFLFGRRCLLLVVMDADTNKPVAATTAKAESTRYVLPWLDELKSLGFSPRSVTTDGNAGVIGSFEYLWPDITMQRCLFHIRTQVTAWMRRKPRYACTKALLCFIASVTKIKTRPEAQAFKDGFRSLLARHKEELASFDPSHPVQGDAIRAYSLVSHALDQCFCYLDNPEVVSTTSALEGYFKQIQRIKGFDHNGLTEEHLFKFLAWRIYFDGQ
jgi:hypothetical protein